MTGELFFSHFLSFLKFLESQNQAKLFGIIRESVMDERFGLFGRGKMFFAVLQYFVKHPGLWNALKLPAVDK